MTRKKIIFGLLDLKEAIQLGVIGGPLSGNVEVHYFWPGWNHFWQRKVYFFWTFEQFPVQRATLFLFWTRFVLKTFPKRNQNLNQNSEKSYIQWKSFRFQWKPLPIHDFPIKSVTELILLVLSTTHIFYVSSTVKNTAVTIQRQFSCILYTQIPKFGFVNENLLKMSNPKLDSLL